MPKSDKIMLLHEKRPNCTILRNIMEPTRKAHCSTMQIHTRIKQTVAPLPPPPISTVYIYDVAWAPVEIFVVGRGGGE